MPGGGRAGLAPKRRRVELRHELARRERLDPQRDERREPRREPPSECADPGCDRDPPPPQPGDDVEHADDERDEQHRDGHLGEPAPQHLPGEEQRRLASALDGDGGVELGDDVGRRGPARPSWAASRSARRRWSPAAPAVSVTAGMSREISGPCSWDVYGTA